MLGQIALSLAAAGVIFGVMYYNQSYFSKVKEKDMQIKQALKYEKNEMKHVTTSYADVNLKPDMIIIADNRQEKDLLRKLRQAVEVALKNNPNHNLTCNDLANTGKITLNECRKVAYKKNLAIVPTNPQVEESIDRDLNESVINNEDDGVVTKLTISQVAETVAPTSYNAKIDKNNHHYSDITKNLVKAKKIANVNVEMQKEISNKIQISGYSSDNIQRNVSSTDNYVETLNNAITGMNIERQRELSDSRMQRESSELLNNMRRRIPRF
jgi:hypothetical protein